LLAAAKATPMLVALDASGCGKTTSCVGQGGCAAEGSGGASMMGCLAQCPALVTGGAKTFDCAAQVTGGMPTMGCIAQCPAIAGGPPFGTGGTAGTGGRVATGGRGGVGPRDGGRDRWVPDASSDAISGSDVDAGDGDH
jgi:hypothetical protein